MDEDDLDVDDAELGAALRRRAGEIAGPADLEAALAVVLDRSRTHRRRRVVMTTVGAAAAAAVVGVLGIAALSGGEREVLRGPATQPGPPASVALPGSTGPTVTSAAPTTASPLPTTAPAPVPPTVATVVVVPPTTVAPASTLAVPSTTPTPTPTGAGPQTTVPAPATPATTVYSSAGGSIRVRLADGRISLEGDPSPTAGWTVRIDDDGPDRVRVRFESGGSRSEIRVDFVGGVLQPRITES